MHQVINKYYLLWTPRFDGANYFFLFLSSGQIRLPNVINDIKPLKKRKKKSTEPVLHRLGIDTKAPKIAMLLHLEPIKPPAQYLWPKPELSKMVPLGMLNFAA